MYRTYRRLISTHKMDEELINHLSKEYARSIQTLLIALKDEKWLTNPMYMNVSKLEVLKVASDCGLNTSATYLVNDRNQLAHLVEKKNLISKSVFDPIIAEWGKRNRGMMYTVEVNKEELSALPSSFLPSMVQEKLEKKYELRIFYLMERCIQWLSFRKRTTKLSWIFAIIIGKSLIGWNHAS